MYPRTLLFCLLMVLLAVPAAGQAQTNLCTLENAGQTRGLTENGESIVLLENNFLVRCSDGEELRANSGRMNQTTGNFYLLGDVFFRDTVQTLTSNEATYDPNTARLWARGNVVYSNLRQGTTLRGPELEYLRATDFRPIPQMTATRRPTLTMPPAEAADPPEPLDLTSDRIEMTGEDQLFAFGDVVITRADLRATSDEARYNSATEELALRRRGVILSEEFELHGDSIDARLAAGRLDFLHSRVGARLEGEDLRVSGDDLQLLFADDLLQRVVAIVREGAEAQATAASATFEIQADSLDALFVDQRLDEVYAIGNAFGASIDTTEVESVPSATDAQARGGVSAAEGGAEGPPSPAPADAARAVEPESDSAPPGRADLPGDVLARDWIRGDTIIGYFVATGPGDVETPEEQMEPENAGDPRADEPLAAADPGQEEQVGAVTGEAAVAEPAARPSVQLRRLVAIGSAQSLYRMPAQNEDLDPDARNVNFLVGRRIVLEVEGGELQVANVEGLQYGVYLEALAPESAADPAATPNGEEEQLEAEIPSRPEEGGA